MPQSVFFPPKKKPKTLPTRTSFNDAKDTPMGGKVSGVAVREMTRGNYMDIAKIGRKTQRSTRRRSNGFSRSDKSLFNRGY